MFSLELKSFTILMGATSSTNEYELIDNSISDAELELMERIQIYEGLTLEESIDKRFPNRKFEIKCFQNIVEIDTKRFSKLEKITFKHLYMGDKNRSWKDITVERSPNQKYILYCDVLDKLITHGYTEDVYDILYYGKLKLNSNSVMFHYSYACESIKPKRVAFNFETKIITNNREYNEILNEPTVVCENCKEPTYMNNSINDNTAYLVECRYMHFRPTIDKTIPANYCGKCCTDWSYSKILDHLEKDFDVLVRGCG
jgi:hypothetical protein